LGCFRNTNDPFIAPQQTNLSSLLIRIQARADENLLDDEVCFADCAKAEEINDGTCILHK
jgi:hypothetical protein